MKKITKIIKSRFIDGESLPQWYEDRLSICSGCEFNSKNVEQKTLKTKVWGTVAGAHCTDCGCTIVHKTKIKQEECPLTPPKWTQII